MQMHCCAAALHGVHGFMRFRFQFEALQSEPQNSSTSDLARPQEPQFNNAVKPVHHDQLPQADCRTTVLTFES
jgi:hypothetical protein